MDFSNSSFLHELNTVRKRINPAGIPYKGSKVVKEKKIEKSPKKVNLQIRESNAHYSEVKKSSVAI